MSLLNWSDKELGFGIPMIDEEHRKMIDMINEAHDLAVQSPVDQLRVSMLFVELHKYVEIHCQKEEELMEKAGYGGLEAHKAEHEAFFVNLQRAHSVHLHEVSKGASQSASVVNLLPMLSDWLKKHIQGTDRAYVPFLKAKGLI